MAFVALLLAGSLAWWRSAPRDKRPMVAAGLMALALAALPVIHVLVVTDRESITRALKSMETRANARDFKSILDLIDPDFRSHGGLDKKGLHALISTLEGRYGVRAVHVRRPEFSARQADGTIPCEFTVRLAGDFGEYVVVAKTTWKKREGVWRVHRVKVTRLLDRDQTPLPV